MPSVWRIEVSDGADRADASSARVAAADATMKQLFPYLGPFDLVYRVRVPWQGASLEGRPFQLRIAGALGRLTLRFGEPAPEAERPHQAP